MTLKQILNAVLSESGFLERASFFSSVDPDDKQMTAIANRMAYQIMNFFNWSGLRATWTLTMTAATSYPLPADFQSFVPDSSFEQDGSRRVEFPVPEGRWFGYKYGSDQGGGLIRAKKYGNTLQIPHPDAGQILEFEYITKYPLTNSAAMPKATFTADDDIWLLDDEVLILGIQQRWGQVKRFPQYPEWKAEYFSKLNEAIGRDTGSRTIGGNPRRSHTPSPYYPLYRTS